MKLFDSELRIMEILWREGESTAKRMADELKDTTGWNVNTTYTMIKRMIGKGIIERREPGFVCVPLVEKASVQAAETDDLIDRVFDGSADLLFASLLSRKRLSKEQIDKLKDMISKLE